MSFPRAKIQRFNDATNSTPAPGSYNPKLEGKVKGTIIEKSGRFTEKSGSDGECPANLSSKCSSMSNLPTFRTPQLPRKAVKTSSKGKSKESAEKQDTIVTSLEDIILRGKDMFSAPDTPELSSLRDQLNEVTKELNEANSKLSEMAEFKQGNEDLQAQVKELQEDLLLARTRHQESVEEFERNSKDYLEQLKEVRNQLEEKYSGVQEELKQVKEELSNVTNINFDLEQKISQKQQMILLLQSELSSSTVELVESKSECVRVMAESSAQVNSLHDDIRQLEQKREEEHEEARKQIQDLSNKTKNGNLVCDSLKSSLEEKEVALWAMELSYEKLLAECEQLKDANRLKLEEMMNNHNAQIREMSQSLEMASKFIESNSLDLKLACDEKLQQLEGRVKCVLERARSGWQDEIAWLKMQLQAGVEKLQEVKAVAQEEISTLRSKSEEKDLMAAAKLKELEAEARIITEKLLRAEEELSRACNFRDELRVSNMEHKLAIVDLQDKLDTATVEKNSIHESLSELTTERDTFKSQNKMLVVGNRNLSQSLKALTQRLLESESDVDRITGQKESLESEKQKFQHEIRVVKEELQNHRISIAKMESENLQQIEVVRKDLLEKLESLKRKAILDSETMQKVDAEKRLQIDGLSIQLEMFRRDFQELGEYVAAIELQNEEQGRKLQTFEEQEKQLQESVLRLAMQEKAYNALSSAFNQQSAELQQWKIELSNAQGKIAAQEEQILEYKCNIEQLSADIEGTEAKILELNDVVNNLEETNSEQEREIEALTEKLDHQRECAQAATQQIANLSSELECHKNFSHQATEHMMNLASANTEKEKQIQCLATEIDTLKGKAHEMVDKMQDLAMELTIVQGKLTESSEEIKLLEADKFVKEEQLQELKVDYERQRECTQQYVSEIAALENLKLDQQQVLSEVNFKIKALEEETAAFEQMVANCDKKLTEETAARQSLENQLNDATAQVSQLTEIKSDLELGIHEQSRKSETMQITLEVEQDRLRSQVSKLLEEVKAKQWEVDALKSSYEKLHTLKMERADSNAEQTIKALEATVAEEQEKLARALEWQQRYEELQSLVGPFKEQLEAYRSECQLLELQKGEVEGEVRALAKQYADILGHQNHRQKIRHLVQLKEQNLELKEEVRVLKRNIEKLRKERTTAPRKATSVQSASKGKENLGRHSPIHKSPAASPNTKPLTPKNTV